ncbi:hypothetical protein [Pantanalinema sp. GBBB05]|uniref:hypothetical protein n=1 Tax=Pantanalinema sp. GBBB05 TaxID=2604139 RepID=UPI003D81B85F
MATLQPANFGRAYAAYGGFFIILSIIWGWKIDNVMPDRMDWFGAAIALTGASAAVNKMHAQHFSLSDRPICLCSRKPPYYA